MQADRQWGQALIESIRVPEHKSFEATGICELLFGYVIDQGNIDSMP
jgi:hypothetical protein